MTIFLTETDVRCFLRPGQNKERLKKILNQNRTGNVLFPGTFGASFREKRHGIKL